VEHAPSHDARDPPLARQQVRRDPFRALDALEEAAIDGGPPKCGRKAEKECERDDGVGVALDERPRGFAMSPGALAAAADLACVLGCRASGLSFKMVQRDEATVSDSLDAR
jgi:hypothetical protein